MARILILGHSSDAHVAAVEWGLRNLNVSATTWRMDRFPAGQEANIEIGGDGSVSVAAADTIARDAQFDVVWFRRRAYPTVHSDLHPSDRRVARDESEQFLRNAINVLAPSARWINPLDRRDFAASKALQLREAALAGFAIPDTLISNDPAAIRRFYRRHDGNVILKPFRSVAWHSGEQRLSLFTANRVKADALASDFSIQAAPGIFQPCLAKEFELRVTVMGAACFAARLSDGHIKGRQAIDWKLDLKKLEIAPYALPDDLRTTCLTLMRRLGLVFGCIDIIRTAAGEWVFLEVNEMGQFLWVEELLPEMPLLAAFAAFLQDGSPEFRWSPPQSRQPTMAEYRASADHRRFEAEEQDEAILERHYGGPIEEVA